MSDFSTFIIAEAGVNHNGSLRMSLELVDAAAEAGADAIKFQTFRAERLATSGAAKAAYQERTTDRQESQLEMLKKLELSDEMHLKIQERCRARNIEFLSTPFDIESLDYLTGTVGLKRIKVPSGELTNGPLLFAVGCQAKEIILSTGMATLAEIEAALAVLVWGKLAPDVVPKGQTEIWDHYSRHGTRPLKRSVILLHCTTDYPAALGDVNLRAMDTMRDAFRLDVGISDHTEGIAIPVAAVARGAKLVEKHMTLDRTLPGPDHAASLQPEEMREMISAIRAVELALGDGRKLPVEAELANRNVVRKSIVAAKSIAKGEALSCDNLSVKRPAGGVSPMLYWDMLGRTASKAYEPDDLLI